MRKTFLLLLITQILLFSCTPTDDLLEADFNATVTGESPNAVVEITNNSTGAKSYIWAFSEGANFASSVDGTPNSIIVDKVGDFEITLIVSNGSKTKEITKSVTIAGKNGIRTYTDVEFAQSQNNEKYGAFFSTTEGRIYTLSEINETTGPKIDLVYSGDSSKGFHFFKSPDDLNDTEFEIPNAINTKIDNYQKGFEVAVFDEMQDDQHLNHLIIENDKRPIDYFDSPVIVLFENEAGKKGAIKLKEANEERLLVDIKVQKY